ncbi:unnamed protein product [Paramecium pentaurelia]|uniref:Uncharacterized protein n=1 Tax=Paramecium pentaurelia TaxID=43138 RepID=A0A8S1V9G2_9CILI|nr:unnamed protein product [Paramecium pentaurelia]
MLVKQKLYMARILEAFLILYICINWLIYEFGENIYTNLTENIFKQYSQNNSSSVSSSIIRSQFCLIDNYLLYFLINYKKKNESYSALIVEDLLEKVSLPHQQVQVRLESARFKNTSYKRIHSSFLINNINLLFFLLC